MEQHSVRSEHATTIAIDQHARSLAMDGLDLSMGEERQTRQVVNMLSMTHYGRKLW